jgi:translocation and assembly module TamB
MSETKAVSTRLNRFLKLLGLVAGVVLLAVVLLLLVLQTDAAHNRIRVFLEQTVNRVSGGTLEIGELRIQPFLLRAELMEVVFHGTESEEEPALFRARRIAVAGHVLSWTGGKFRIASIEVNRPGIHISLYEDGSTNFPVPPKASDGPPVTHTLVDLGVRQFAITEGLIEVAEQRVPLDIRGEGLDLRLLFLPTLERYEGNLAMQRFSFTTDAIDAIPFAFETNLRLGRDDLMLSEAELRHQESRISFSVDFSDFAAPSIEVPFNAELAVADFHQPFSLPVEPTGNATAAGTFRFADGAWNLSGDVEGSGFGFRSGDVRVSDVGLQSGMRLEADAFVFPDLRVEALGGTIAGEAAFRDGRNFTLQADIEGVTLEQATRASGLGEVAYHTILGGNLNLEVNTAASGTRGVRADADLQLRATEGENPVSGEIQVAFAGADGSIRLSDSFVELTQSYVRLDGDIRSGLRVDFGSRDLRDFLPALAFAVEEPENLLVVSVLSGGDLTFQGVVSGEWEAPVAEGTLRASNIAYEDYSLDALALRLHATQDGLRVRDLTARQGNIELLGDGELPLQAWSPAMDREFQANVSASATSLDTILAEAGQEKLPVSGSLHVQLDAAGTLNKPVASLRARLRDATMWDEPVDEVVLDASYEGQHLTLHELQLLHGNASAKATGEYLHEPGEYRKGRAELDLLLDGIQLGEFQIFAARNLDADAQVNGKFHASLELAGEDLEYRELGGELAVTEIAYAGQPVGQLILNLDTDNGVTTGKLKGKLVDSTIDGEASVALRGNYPAKGQFSLDKLTLDAVRGWLPATLSTENLPVSILMVSKGTFEGPLTKPDEIQAELVIDELRLARILSGSQTLTQAQPFEVSNERPIRFNWNGTTLQASDATLTGSGTSLSLGGSITPGNAKQQLNLRAQGDLNFRVFNAFESSLEAGGSSVLDLTVEGTFAKPNVQGVLDLRDASIYLVGVPNGLDRVNGRVFLTGDRATIEEITAQSGGGDLTMSGFVSYVSGTPTFRLSFRGEDVRVRYPPGVSTSANAALELSGSTEQSILSGEVIITRAAVNPRSDLASILSAGSKPVATPSANQNEMLRNLRFDVRVRTAPDVRFDSTLTQDLSGEADLRLRGNPYSPVLLGSVAINQGEINFFGNRYFIDRGDISFINPLKLEPVLNLDLRTRVRSIDVTLTFSGPIDKLNINYRSDPPLQLNEIIALLTVGRAPQGAPSLAEAQNEAAQSWQQVGASALVGQAVAAPIAGRLQRFFGVSRIKIDPRLTGVENNPQARLTVEQQVNRDITVTFITNLAGTQQQVVRLEWNFNPQFSMVALRDEDGLFGIDFLYRRRF